jgi:hypothetical protein
METNHTMHSNAKVKLYILVALVFVVFLAVECLTRAIHDRRKITLQIEGGLRQAMGIRRRDDSRQLLFAGNSLVYEDLQQPALQREMGAGFVVYAAGVPGSTYYDWRYGLRALFARGSQPDVLVFSISPSQFLRPAAVTPVPVSVLWSAREIVAYEREQRLSLTTFSELLFEHYSNYFSLRNIVRIYVRKFIPGYEAMLDSWSRASDGPQAAIGPQSAAALDERLARLAAECGPRVRLMLVVPPTNQVADEQAEPYLRAAAERAGIPLIEPVAVRGWSLADFQQDGYHLTVAAASRFSRLVAADLKRRLGDSRRESLPGALQVEAVGRSRIGRAAHPTDRAQLVGVDAVVVGQAFAHMKALHLADHDGRSARLVADRDRLAQAALHLDGTLRDPGRAHHLAGQRSQP